MQIYGDMLFLAELYRQDSTSYGRALDSMYRVNAVDSAQINTTMRELSGDTKELSAFYEQVMNHLEKRAKVDRKGGKSHE